MILNLLWIIPGLVTWLLFDGGYAIIVVGSIIMFLITFLAIIEISGLSQRLDRSIQKTLGLEPEEDEESKLWTIIDTEQAEGRTHRSGYLHVHHDMKCLDCSHVADSMKFKVVSTEIREFTLENSLHCPECDSKNTEIVDNFPKAKIL